MGASGKWLKSLIAPKKTSVDDQVGFSRFSFSLVFFFWDWIFFSLILLSFLFLLGEKIGDEGKSKKKWKLWRSSSEGFGSSSSKVASTKTASVASFVAGDSFAAAMATVARAPPKDFKAVKQEWAAIRIQAVFRGLLVREISLLSFHFIFLGLGFGGGISFAFLPHFDLFRYLSFRNQHYLVMRFENSLKFNHCSKVIYRYFD